MAAVTIRAGPRTARLRLPGSPANALLLAAWSVACGAEGGPERNGSTSEIRHAVRAPASRLALVESLRIGVQSGDPSYELGRIRDVAVDDIGRIYVLDLLNKLVRVYGADGGYVRTIGRPGAGPGEFSVPIALDVAGDTVQVWDERLWRLTAFDTAGALRRTQSVQPLARSGWPVSYDRLATGGWLHLD